MSAGVLAGFALALLASIALDASVLSPHRPALPVIARMTAPTNLVAIAGGLVVCAEPPGASAASSAAHVVAFAPVGAAAWRLSVAQARMVHASA
ncbi:MAG: hypothetical protein QOH72_3449 [Solirubrobacteraceae bacterium]|jgi:hypothetical protein|nr:hypothetical protein [Solirubrobacteraceae bacterium]